MTHQDVINKYIAKEATNANLILHVLFQKNGTKDKEIRKGQVHLNLINLSPIFFGLTEQAEIFNVTKTKIQRRIHDYQQSI